MNKRISVIIPAFNHGEELVDALHALERQSLQPAEVIVVDDGSDTPITLKRDAYNLPLTLIRLDKNQGAPKARNTGFEASAGELVMFLDADAVLADDALASLASALEESGKEFAYSDFLWGRRKFSTKTFSAEELKRGSYIHTSALIRREAFPGFDESLKKLQDWDLFLTMAERGSVGIHVPRVLFTVKPRKTGYSQWLPSFAYDLPWRILPFMPKTIRKFRDAEAIVRAKHRLAAKDETLAEHIFVALLLIVIAEALSAAVVFFPLVNGIFALLLTMIFFIAAYRMPAAGFAILIGELVIGSKGELFKIGADAENNGGISIRMLFFAAFLVAWAIKAEWKPFLAFMRDWLKDRWEYPALAIVLVLAFVHGMSRRNPFLFADANAWGYLLLLAPALELSLRKGSVLAKTTSAAIFAGLAYVSVKTLMLFYLFSHPFGTWMESVYYWLRKSGIGEVTRILEGASAHRVFFQSHIFEVLALSPTLLLFFFGKTKRSWWGLLFVLCFTAVLISFSRSFWIAALLSLFILKAFVVLRTGELGGWFSVWKRTAVLAAASIGLVLLALFFPIPPPTGVNLSDTLIARLSSEESALKSRWLLLPALWDGIREAPVTGHGFGAVLTYRSLDPRVVQATGGEYTTYAFEWGWLDFWYKFGIAGFLLMLYLIAKIAWRFLKLPLPAWKKMLPLTALAALAMTHVFTPYLNHPLGFGMLILLEAALVLESKHHLLSETYD